MIYPAPHLVVVENVAAASIRFILLWLLLVQVSDSLVAWWFSEVLVRVYF